MLINFIVKNCDFVNCYKYVQFDKPIAEGNWYDPCI